MASTKTLQIYNTYIAPATDALLDLGSSVLEFKDLYIDGVAYIDGFGEDTDMGDFDIHSIDGLYGYDDNVYIDMGTDGRIVIQADGAGTPFATPDIDITGTTYFDDDMGLLLDKKILFGDTAVSVWSDDDGHLDLTADISVDINGALLSTPDEITATNDGVAASVVTVNTEVTTNGDEDLDNVTLANGISGQIKHIYCVVETHANDTWKITPATMCGGTQITFAGVGLGCTLVYADSEGWVVVANNGGTIS